MKAVEVSKDDLIILFKAWNNYIQDFCLENSRYDQERKAMMNKYNIQENDLSSI